MPLASEEAKELIQKYSPKQGLLTFLSTIDAGYKDSAIIIYQNLTSLYDCLGLMQKALQLLEITVSQEGLLGEPLNGTDIVNRIQAYGQLISEQISSGNKQANAFQWVYNRCRQFIQNLVNVGVSFEPLPVVAFSISDTGECFTQAIEQAKTQYKEISGYRGEVDGISAESFTILATEFANDSKYVESESNREEVAQLIAIMGLFQKEYWDEVFRSHQIHQSAIEISRQFLQEVPPEKIQQFEGFIARLVGAYKEFNCQLANWWLQRKYNQYNSSEWPRLSGQPQPAHLDIYDEPFLLDFPQWGLEKHREGLTMLCKYFNDLAGSTKGTLIVDPDLITSSNKWIDAYNNVVKFISNNLNLSLEKIGCVEIIALRFGYNMQKKVASRDLGDAELRQKVAAEHEQLERILGPAPQLQPHADLSQVSSSRSGLCSTRRGLDAEAGTGAGVGAAAGVPAEAGGGQKGPM